MSTEKKTISDATQHVNYFKEILCKEIPFNNKNIIELTTMRFKWIIQQYINSERFVNDKMYEETNGWIAQYTDDEIEEMAYISSLRYLKLCLESNTKQSLTSFRIDPFGLSSTGKKTHQGVSNINGTIIKSADSIYCSYFRCKRILENNYYLRSLQKYKETTDKISWKDINDKIGSEKFKLGKLNFLELAFIDMYHNKYLEIVDHILIYEKPLQKTLSNGSPDSLPAAYEQLNKMLDDMSKFNDSRKFVSYCFQLLELESTYHFFLVARIAEYMVKNNIPKETEFPYILHVIMCRMKYDNVEGIDNSYVFYKYDEIVERAFLVDERIKDNYLTINDALQKFNKLCYGRKLTYWAVGFYAKMFPVSEQPKWKYIDFDSLAVFFRRKFKIFERFKKVEPNTTNAMVDYNKVYDYIRAVYSSPYFVDQEAFSFVRKNSQKYKKPPKKGTRIKSIVMDNKSSDE